MTALLAWRRSLPRGAGCTVDLALNPKRQDAEAHFVMRNADRRRVSEGYFPWSAEWLRGCRDNEIRSIADQAIKAGAPRPPEAS